MPRETIPMSTKTIKVHVWGKKKVSIHGVTLHCTYQGFQQCFLVYPTDAQNVAPVGKQLLPSFLFASMRKTNRLTVSRHRFLYWHILEGLLATCMEQSRFQTLAQLLQTLASTSRSLPVLRVIFFYRCGKVLLRYSSEHIK